MTENGEYPKFDESLKSLKFWKLDGCRLISLLVPRSYHITNFTSQMTLEGMRRSYRPRSVVKDEWNVEIMNILEFLISSYQILSESSNFLRKYYNINAWIYVKMNPKWRIIKILAMIKRTLNNTNLTNTYEYRFTWILKQKVWNS